PTHEFTSTVTDTYGATSSTTLLISFPTRRSSDLAVADSNGADAVTESGVNPGNTPFTGDPSATGNVLTNDTDVDTGHAKTVAAVDRKSTRLNSSHVDTSYAVIRVNKNTWTYALDN